MSAHYPASGIQNPASATENKSWFRAGFIELVRKAQALKKS
jgi:hypothetical protein